MKRCIVCGHKYYYPLFNPGPQPLAALNLPHSQEDAKDALRFPMRFVLCAFCGHIYNTEFNYAQIPYGEDSNLMYNSGSTWTDHLQHVMDMLLQHRSKWESETAIDIGCGDGQFFSCLQNHLPNIDCVGYEPGIEAKKIQNFTIVKDYFIPERDLKRFRPSLLVCRHVLEHLDKPRDFVAEIIFWCNAYNLSPLLLFEVPCIDKALLLGRISDFLYEHVSNFTIRSFNFLFKTVGCTVLENEVCYNDEVLVGLFTAQDTQLSSVQNVAKYFRKQASNSLTTVIEQLHSLPKPLYFWGGTGKSAAFLNTFEVNADEFPFVVDSDNNKVDRFVPGTGQKIRPVNWLLEQSPGIIVITTPWRAKDIYQEIFRRGIQSNQIMVLWKGILRRYDEIARNL